MKIDDPPENRVCSTKRHLNQTDAYPLEKKDMKWLMMGATHIEVHSHEAKAKGGNEGMSRTKRGLRIPNCT